MESAICKARAVIKDKTIVSFDIFDTLIYRAVVKPRDIFSLVSTSKRCAVSMQYFADKRVQAETQAREEYARLMCSSEIKLEDIYKIFCQKNALHSSFVNMLKKEELKSEINLSFPSPLGKALYQEAKKMGKRIIFISDMYLTKKFVTYLLRKNGYSHFEKLFVSGCDVLSKHEGSVFRYLIDSYKIDPSSIVHFGDNIYSDVTQPKIYGITAQHIEFKEYDSPKREYYQNDIGHSLAFGLPQHIISGNSFLNKKNYSTLLGVSVYGPIIFGYLLWLSSFVQHNNITKILFMARDMYVIYNEFNKYKTFFGLDYVESEYVWLQRSQLLKAFFNPFIEHNNKTLLASSEGLTPYDFFDLLNIDSLELRAKFLNYNFDDNVFAQSQNVIDYLRNNFFDILQSNLQLSTCVLKYIEKIFGNHRNIAISDVGYSGTNQSTIDNFTDGLFPCVNITTALLGKSPYANIESMNVKSWLNPIFPNEAMGGFAELLEIPLIGNQRKLFGYKTTNSGEIIPCFKESIISNNRLISKEIQEGIGIFLKFAIPMLNNYDIRKLNCSGWADPFLDLVLNPTIQQAELLGGLTHDCFVSESTRRPLAKKVDVGCTREEFDKDYQESFWKSAFMLRNNYK